MQKAELRIKSRDRLHKAYHFFFRLLHPTENMPVILSELLEAHQAMQGTTWFITVHEPKFSEANRQLSP